MPTVNFTFSTNPTYQDAWLNKTTGLTLHLVLASLSLSRCSKCKPLKCVFLIHLILWDKVSSWYIKKAHSHGWKAWLIH